MKKIVTLAVASGLALFLSGCGATNAPAPQAAETKASDAYGLDVSKVCEISATNSLQDVLGLAKKFNPIAVKNQVEFMRFGMPTSAYIAETEKALAAGGKEVVLLDAKGEPTKNKVTVEYATERACKFSITALQSQHEASAEWKLAVPGDGYTY
jgi:basic membrane lipoprotein Med (substrate-binding protein (PBP1-ABC) superfamily)